MLNTYYAQYCGRHHWGGKKNEGNPSEIHYFYCSSYTRQRERSGDHPTPTPQCLRGSWNTRQSPNSENTVVQIHRCLKIFPTNKYMSSECSVQKRNRSKLLSQTRPVELLQHQEFNDHQGYLQGQVQACCNIAGFCQCNPSQRLRKTRSSVLRTLWLAALRTHSSMLPTPQQDVSSSSSATLAAHPPSQLFLEVVPPAENAVSLTHCTTFSEKEKGQKKQI